MLMHSPCWFQNEDTTFDISDLVKRFCRQLLPIAVRYIDYKVYNCTIRKKRIYDWQINGYSLIPVPLREYVLMFNQEKNGNKLQVVTDFIVLCPCIDLLFWRVKKSEMEGFKGITRGKDLFRHHWWLVESANQRLWNCETFWDNWIFDYAIGTG